MDFTKPATQSTQLEAPEDYEDEAPEVEGQQRPTRRERIASPKTTSRIRTIDTAQWKQQQVTGWKRPYLGNWG